MYKSVSQPDAFRSTERTDRISFSHQVLAGLLFLTAVAALALTLGEDYGPSSDSAALKNPAVLYVNPVLFAVSWVS